MDAPEHSRKNGDITESRLTVSDCKHDLEKCGVAGRSPVDDERFKIIRTGPQAFTPRGCGVNECRVVLPRVDLYTANHASPDRRRLKKLGKITRTDDSPARARVTPFAAEPAAAPVLPQLLNSN